MRTSILVERGLVFRIAVGRIISGTPAELLAAVHRRSRASRRAHADRAGHFFGTVIHHASGLALAAAQLAIAVAVILQALCGALVASASHPLLLRALR